jgi:hypothetical protein
VIIETWKKKNTKQLVEQAVQQFGEPVIEKGDDQVIYKWIDLTAGHKFSSTLVVDEAKGTGVFNITR